MKTGLGLRPRAPYRVCGKFSPPCEIGTSCRPLVARSWQKDRARLERSPKNDSHRLIMPEEIGSSAFSSSADQFKPRQDIPRELIPTARR